MLATEPPNPLDYRRSNLLNWRVERQDVAKSEVGPWTAHLNGRQFCELRREFSVIVGRAFYVQDVRYLAVPWMARSLFAYFHFARQKKVSRRSRNCSAIF